MTEGVDCEAGARGHEPSDVAVRRLLVWAAALVAFVLAGVGLSVAVHDRIGVLYAPAAEPVPALHRAERMPTPPAFGEAPASRPPPTAYGWVDRDGGIAMIPLEEARRILAAGGWPADGPP